MVDFSEIQDYMTDQLHQTKQFRKIRISGNTLDDALNQATIELALPLNRIEYEIVDYGSKGILGINRRPCRIFAYPRVVVEKSTPNFTELVSKVQKEEGINGTVEIRKEAVGVMMKVSAPAKGGVRATEQEAIDLLQQKNILNADLDLVAKLIKKADDFFVKIADFKHNPSEDAELSLSIQDMEMRAYITISPPGLSGADISLDSLKGLLDAKGVVFGLKDDVLGALASNPQYNEPILVAEGKRVKKGKDGYVEYKFEANTDHLRLMEIDGKVDYKELGKINNVLTGETLAKIVDPGPGEDGHTVTGQVTLASSGKSETLEIGTNVELSEDGKEARAKINGQVLLINGKITVEPVFVVNNGVNLKTGNILFLGTVLVTGNVDDGFSVKASGNIEIVGSVGKCELDAEGDIIIRQGMNGRDTGKITSGGNVYAKFIQNTRVSATGMVVVSDGIINSHVSSDSKILCKGRRASIVGGSIHAAEEINAKTLGSIVNVETVLEVGFDPKSKAQIDALKEEDAKIQDRLEDIKKDILMLDRLIQTQKKLPPDRQKRYDDLKNELAHGRIRREEIDSEQTSISEHLSALKTAGKISASKFIYPGVKISIKDAFLEVRSEYKKVTFVNDDNVVKVTNYEEIEDEISLGRIPRRI